MNTQIEDQMDGNRQAVTDWNNFSIIKTEKGHYEYKKLEDGWYTRKREMGKKVSKVQWIDQNAGLFEFKNQFKSQMNRWAR